MTEIFTGKNIFLNKVLLLIYESFGSFCLRVYAFRAVSSLVDIPGTLPVAVKQGATPAVCPGMLLECSLVFPCVTRTFVRLTLVPRC